eukprot:TRINITY_DN16852_c0_g1_i1.p1 TRINITY_DN16852_c0_g1~~TRINITY_DN16852_c0_g1_i1.p1  ORF type:complete len:340 (-),score=83.98 TRINITY_DN16852_c0_g1_i1:274-1269(-)
MAAMHCWQRLVSSDMPCSIKGLPMGCMAEIRGFTLQKGRSSVLYVSSATCKREENGFAVGQLSEATPQIALRLPVGEGMSLTCSVGQILVFGVFSAFEVEGVRGPPSKRARLALESLQSRTATNPASVTPVRQAMHEADADLEDRRAMLRKATDESKERSRSAAEKEALERQAADELAEKKRAASRAAAEELAKAKAAKIEKQRAAQELSEKKKLEAANPNGRQTLASGLQYDVVRQGAGVATAANGKKVSVLYEGRLAKTGKIFDKGTIRFALGRGEVIKGWDEGIRGMRVGEQRRLLIPAHLGYGKSGSPPKIPPNATLIFVVSLHQLL